MAAKLNFTSKVRAGMVAERASAGERLAEADVVNIAQRDAAVINQPEAGTVPVAPLASHALRTILVEDVVNYLRQNGFSSVEEVEVMPENVRFGLPPEIIQAIGNTNGATIPVR